MALTQIDPSMIPTDAIDASKIAADAVGSSEIAAGAVATSELGDLAVTPAKMSQKITLGTSVATTSGTAIDLSTSIPSWVKRITIACTGVSLNGSSHSIIQVGSGSYTTSGYVSTGAYAGTANSAGVASATNGLIVHGGSSTNAFTGTMTLVNISGNTWVESHCGSLNTTIGVMGGGSITLGGALDRIRIASANSADVFDAGSVNILFEG